MAKTDMQLLLYQFLQKHQTESSTFTKEELLEQVGWKPSTFKSYYGKGQITQFLAENVTTSLRIFDANNDIATYAQVAICD